MMLFATGVTCCEGFLWFPLVLTIQLTRVDFEAVVLCFFLAWGAAGQYWAILKGRTN